MMPWYKLNYGDNIFTTNLYLEYMKKIYSLLFVALFLFLGYSCDDGSLDHSDVFIPEPVVEKPIIIAEEVKPAVVIEEPEKEAVKGKHEIIPLSGDAEESSEDGPKVLGTINLDQINQKTRPSRKSKAPCPFPANS